MVYDRRCEGERLGGECWLATGKQPEPSWAGWGKAGPPSETQGPDLGAMGVKRWTGNALTVTAVNLFGGMRKEGIMLEMGCWLASKGKVALSWQLW